MCNFSKIVSLYQTGPRAVNRGSYQEWLVEHLRFFEGLKSMSEAIEEAALGRHAHQRRVKSSHRRLAADQLKKKTSDLESHTTFKQIYATVEACIQQPSGPFQSAPLFTYDLSLRIGFYKRIYPQDVYLHCGALRGAQAILKTRKLPRFVPISTFPVEFAVLKAYEIENCLCNYEKIRKTICSDGTSEECTRSE